MKKFLGLIMMSLIACTNGHAALTDLDLNDKDSCLQQLEEATDTELWDVFLQSQATLFFDSEVAWVGEQEWWHNAQNVLELGSGNGAYLAQLANRYPEKNYQGVDIIPELSQKANAQYGQSNLHFHSGDAQVYQADLEGSADVVLFRYTLQHLADPTAALNEAAKYLSKNGHIVILDAYDSAHQTNHPNPLIDDVMARVMEQQQQGGYGNRQITSQLLQSFQLDTGLLSDIYKVIFSSIDAKGNFVIPVWFVDKLKAIPYVKHTLMMLALVKRVYHVAVEMGAIFDELKRYLEDPNAWSAPGVHCLVLEKK